MLLLMFLVWLRLELLLLLMSQSWALLLHQQGWCIVDCSRRLQVL